MRRSGARLGAGTPPAHPDIREEFSRFMDSERKIRIVPMNGDHLDEIAALERVCFPDPWSRDMLAEELENDLAAFLVAVAVRPDCRRQGVAKELLQVFLDFAKGNRLAFLTLEVRASNYPAIALYGSRGFRGTGRRKNYYEHPREDAVIMTLDLAGGEEET